MTEVETNNYKKALVEVDSVLKCLNYETYKKIPPKLFEIINKNKDEKYIFEYDKDLDYNEWNLMPETKSLLYNILKMYLVTEEQKQYFNKKEQFERTQIENEKNKKYNTDNIFKKKDETTIHQDLENNVQLIEVKKYPWYKKLYYQALKILGIKH